MVPTPVYVGADVAKDSIELFAPAPLKLPASIPNNPKGFSLLIRKLLHSEVSVHVVLEATGACHQRLVKALHAAEIPCSVMNPRQVRDFARAKGRLAKTDQIDAQDLSLYGECLKPKPTALPDPVLEELALLCTRRAELVAMQAQEKNRLQQFDHRKVLRSINDNLKGLAKAIAKIEAEIDDLLKRSAMLEHKVKLLSSIKGVGKLSAAMLLAAMPELGTLSRNQAAALAGLAPMNRDSGTYRGKRTIHGGRTQARRALFMAAFSAAQHNDHLQPFYQRLLAAGKPHKLALTAVMRKLLIHLNSLLKPLSQSPT